MSIMDTDWMDEGSCTQDEEVRRLFLLPYLEEFNEDDFYTDAIGNEKLTRAQLRERKFQLQQEMEEKRMEHQLGYNMYTQVAKNVCQSCPVLQQCQEFVMQKEAQGEDIFGVAGGYTKEERRDFLNPDSLSA